jgi:hypothetical protein
MATQTMRIRSRPCVRRTIVDTVAAAAISAARATGQIAIHHADIRARSLLKSGRGLR